MVTKIKQTNLPQIIIICGLIFLMSIALIIDGEMGNRVFGSLMTMFGLTLGYFFRKATEK